MIHEITRSGHIESEAPLGRRARKRLARENAITAVALNLVAEGGLDALSLHRVAHQLDLAVGALYRYFDSKAALIAHLEFRVIRALRTRLEAECDGLAQPVGPAGYLQNVLVVARAYREAMHENPAWKSLLDGILADRKHILETEDAKSIISEMMSLIRFCGLPIVSAEEAEVLLPGDTDERVVVFWSAIRGVMQLEKLEELAPKTLNAQALFDATTTTLLVGWGADADAVSEASRRIKQQTLTGA